jgi:hypothetical protein
MKKTLLFIFVILLTTPLFSQKGFEVLNTKFELNAVRNGQPVRLETKDFGLKVNYQTGEFFSKINLTKARLYADSEIEYRIPGDEFLEITGNIPINEILDNSNQKQILSIELNVNHLSTIVPVVFHFEINKLENTARGFTLFNVSGPISLTDYGVEDLKGYEPEVQIVLNFQLMMMGD